jgi:hypothetical protein
LVEEIGLPGENYQPVVSHWHTLSHIVVSNTSSHNVLGVNVEVPLLDNTFKIYLV